MMQRLKSFLRRTVGRRCYHARARIAFAMGRHEAAHDLLRRVVTLAPGSFSAHFLLARLQSARGHEEEALQEFGVCYRLDPDRLLRQPLDDLVRQRVLEEANRMAEPDLFNLPPAGAGPLPGEWDDLLGVHESVAEAPLSLAGSDFATAAEARRFSRLDPIRAEEVSDVNLDELLQQLISDAQPDQSFDQG